MTVLQTKKYLKDTMNRDKAIEKISKMSGEYRIILTLRYIKMLSWEDISDRMNYCTRNVYRKHNKALYEFAKLMEAE